MRKSTTLLHILCFLNTSILLGVNSNLNENRSISPRVQRGIFNVIVEQPLAHIVNISERTISWVASFIPIMLSYLFKPLTNCPSLIKSDLPLSTIEVITDEYSSGIKNEDIRLNITELIRKYGFPVEKHIVPSDDGYILSMYRIPRNGSVVLLMHGLLSSSDDWVTPGPESSIAYLLASEGYDVWMGNARGNKHSRRHLRLSPENAQFWDFSWNEIGRYDLPAMIDYVLNVTGQRQLKYVGHSQGTTAFFVMCSEKPEYNDKISLMVALSPVAWMSHLKSPVVKLFSPLNPFLFMLFQSFGVHEFLPPSILIKSLQILICGKQPLSELLCSNLVFIICGFNYAQLNVTNLPVFFSHLPAGASTKQIAHYGQEVVSGKFRKFDYGQKVNIIKYKVKEPPEYSVEKITAQVALFYSDEDWLASVVDVQILRSKLKNVVDFYKVPDKNFNHLDFILAKDIKKLIFSRISMLFKMF